jgi:hypothetical protein
MYERDDEVIPLSNAEGPLDTVFKEHIAVEAESVAVPNDPRMVLRLRPEVPPPSPIIPVACLAVPQQTSTPLAESNYAQSSPRMPINTNCVELLHYRAHLQPRLLWCENTGHSGVMNGASHVLDTIESLSFQSVFVQNALFALVHLNANRPHTPLIALDHYHSALQAVNCHDLDINVLANDGTFFTHIVLLVFELLAAEKGRAEMWYSHVQTLLVVADARRQCEYHPRLRAMWFAGIVDLYGSLTTGRQPLLLGSLLARGEVPRDGVLGWQVKVVHLGYEIALATAKVRGNLVAADLPQWQQKAAKHAWEVWEQRPTEEEAQEEYARTGVDVFSQVGNHQYRTGDMR